MQKSNNKASILIWATFLSLIITVTFVGISTSINKNLKVNSTLTKQFQIENQIKNLVNSGTLDLNIKSLYLDNGDKLMFEKTNKSIITLKKGETHTGKIITSNSNINIKILDGGPVSYVNLTSSGVVNDIKTFRNNTIETYFYIKNLGGYSKIMISSDKTGNFLSKYRKYTIYKKIGNKEVIKNKGTIKNF